MEDPDYLPTLSSILRIVHALDRGLILKIASFSEMLDWVASLGSERDMLVPNFENDRDVIPIIDKPRSTDAPVFLETRSTATELMA